MIRTAALAAALFLAPPAAAQMVVDGVGAVTEQEVDAFLIADANRDGALTLSEFRVMMRQMAAAGHGTAQLVRTFGAYRFAFRQVDLDRNGIATPAELRAAETEWRDAN